MFVPYYIIQICLVPNVVAFVLLPSDMAASLLGRFFYSDASSHDNDTHFPPRGDFIVPSNSPVTELHSPSSQPCSRSSSPSLGHMVIAEHVTASSSIPIDAILSDSELPRSIEPDSKAGQSSKESQPSAAAITKGKNYDPIPSQHHFYHPSAPNFHPTLVLQNKGSVARDHLASERTFLAYVRTSLGMASAGIALVQLFTMADLVSKSTGVPLPAVNQKLQKFAAPLGLAAVAMSIIVLLIGELLFIPHDHFLLIFYYIYI